MGASGLAAPAGALASTRTDNVAAELANLLFGLGPAAPPSRAGRASIRKWDERVYFAGIRPPADDPAAASRVWRTAEQVTGVTYLDEVRL
jgi:hypothetical protein